MNGTAVTNRLQNSFKITCTDHRIIEILGLRPSNRLPVSYYFTITLRLKFGLIRGMALNGSAPIKERLLCINLSSIKGITKYFEVKSLFPST